MYPISRVQVSLILSFALGIVGADKASVLSLTYLYFFVLALILSLLLSKKFSFKCFLLSLLCFLLGSGLVFVKTPEILTELGESVYLEGRVIESKEGKHELFLAVDRLNGEAKKPFKLSVKKAYQDKTSYLLGGRYAFKGKLSLPLEKTNLGGFDESHYLKSKGIFYTLKSKNQGELLSPPQGINAFILKNRAWFKKTFLTYLEKEEAYFLEAVLFGEKGYLDKDFYALAQKMGLAHLFAVSGLHVGFLALVLLLVFKKTHYINHTLMLMLLGLVLCYYTLLAGGVYSAFRASGLIFLTYLLKYTHLYRDLPTLLAWLLALVLVFNPFALYDIGLLFSFSLALGLGLFYPRLRGALPKSTRYLKKGVLDAFVLSISAELISLPLVAHYFYMVTPLGLFYNFLLVPFFSILVPLVFLASLGALVYSGLGKGLFFVLHLFLKGFFFTFESLYQVFKTGHYYVGSPSPYWLLAYLLFLVFLYHVFLKKGNKRKKQLCLLFFTLLLLTLPNPAPKDLRLSVLDVGQGSGATYQLKGGKWLVFDTGPSPSTLANHLRYMGVNEIEAIVLSHGDKDHVGGLYELLRDFKVHHLILSEYAYENSENLAFLKEKSALPKLHFINQPKTVHLGEDKKLLLDLVDKLEAPNSHEVVAYLKDKKVSYLIPGDTEGRALEEIKFSSPVTILLVPHHGSKNSFSEAFYLRYRPNLAVISAGRDNRFFHPHKEVTEGLKGLGIDYAQTAEGGALYFFEKNEDLVMQRGLLN